MHSRSRRGYTLVEIMIVTGIFVLLSMMILANYRGGNRNQQLKLAGEQVSAAIGLAKSKAYSNAAQEICDSDGLVCKSGSACDGAYPSGCSNKYVWQYGMKFGMDSGHAQYVIGADYNADGVYNTGEIISGGRLKLPQDLSFDSYWADPNYDILFAYNATNSSPFGCTGSCVKDIIIRDTVTGRRFFVEFVAWADTYYSWMETP